MKNAYGSDPYICSFLEMITLMLRYCGIKSRMVFRENAIVEISDDVKESISWKASKESIQKSRIQWFSKKSMMEAVCFYKCQITNLVAKYTEIAI